MPDNPTNDLIEAILANADDKGSDKAADLLDGIAKGVGVAASLTLPASAIYDWSFYQAVGLRMSQVPTSLADHARSAVIWFPFILISLLPSLLVGLIYHRYIVSRAKPLGNTEGDAVEHVERMIRKIHKDRREVLRVALGLSLFAAIVYVLFGEKFYLPQMILPPLLWLAFASWYVLHPKMVLVWSQRATFLAMSLPVIIYIVWMFGHIDGLAVAWTPLKTELIVKGNRTPEKIAVLRYMDKGLLMKESGGRIVFLQWEQIESVSQTPGHWQFTGVLCKVWHECYELGVPK